MGVPVTCLRHGLKGRFPHLITRCLPKKSWLVINKSSNQCRDKLPAGTTPLQPSQCPFLLSYPVGYFHARVRARNASLAVLSVGKRELGPMRSNAPARSRLLRTSRCMLASPKRTPLESSSPTRDSSISAL